MATYAELLRDPRWQRKRLEILERDNWRCTECGDSGSTLHVHHIFYVSRRNPWEYLNGTLQTLCEVCHSNKEAEIEHQRGYCAKNPEFAGAMFEDWEYLVALNFDEARLAGQHQDDVAVISK